MPRHPQIQRKNHASNKENGRGVPNWHPFEGNRDNAKESPPDFCLITFALSFVRIGRIFSPCWIITTSGFTFCMIRIIPTTRWRSFCSIWTLSPFFLFISLGFILVFSIRFLNWCKREYVFVTQWFSSLSVLKLIKEN